MNTTNEQRQAESETKRQWLIDQAKMLESFYTSHINPNPTMIEVSGAGGIAIPARVPAITSLKWEEWVYYLPQKAPIRRLAHGPYVLKSALEELLRERKQKRVDATDKLSEPMRAAALKFLAWHLASCMPDVSKLEDEIADRYQVVYLSQLRGKFLEVLERKFESAQKAIADAQDELDAMPRPDREYEHSQMTIRFLRARSDWLEQWRAWEESRPKPRGKYAGVSIDKLTNEIKPADIAEVRKCISTLLSAGPQFEEVGVTATALAGEWFAYVMHCFAGEEVKDAKLRANKKYKQSSEPSVEDLRSARWNARMRAWGRTSPTPKQEVPQQQDRILHSPEVTERVARIVEFLKI